MTKYIPKVGEKYWFIYTDNGVVVRDGIRYIINSKTLAKLFVRKLIASDAPDSPSQWTRCFRTKKEALAAKQAIEKILLNK